MVTTCVATAPTVAANGGPYDWVVNLIPQYGDVEVEPCLTVAALPAYLVRHVVVTGTTPHQLEDNERTFELSSLENRRATSQLCWSGRVLEAPSAHVQCLI